MLDFQKRWPVMPLSWSLSLSPVAMVLLTALGPAARFPGEPGSDPWMRRPNDPEYANTWQYFSHIPYDQITQVPDEQARLGSGMHVDRAWQIHTGTPATKIAVLDSGILWDSPDLRERYALNAGELPLPSGANIHDANGDGRISPLDWIADPRLAVLARKGYLTPEDLMNTFSDGIDSDGNGFVDDISGWDFLENDKNPADRTEFGHGTMEGNMSAGAVNNGIESAGVCGNCSVAFLRVNDSFMADSNNIAAALRYAVDNGFSVVQAALGPFNLTPALHAAVEYAWKNDVVVVATAGDENSFHSNQPAVLDQVLYVNALRYDDKTPQESSSYLAFNNCSNFGARLDVSASGKSCSSEATARLAGIVALAKSFASQTGRHYSSAEIIATVRHTADDINLGDADASSGRMPSTKGWDSTTGNGRVNAATLLQAIQRDEMFPGGRIISPGWFDVTRDGGPDLANVPVKVSVPLPRTGRLQLSLSIQKGVEEEGAELFEVGRTPILTGNFEDQIAILDFNSLAQIKASPFENSRYHDAWTLILDVDDLSGRVSRVRRTIFRLDQPGSSVQIFRSPNSNHASVESAPLFYDIDGDGRDELAFADGGGLVHLLDSNDGTVPSSAGDISGERPGFPVAMPLSRLARAWPGGIFSALAAGEIQAGKPVLVAVSIEGHVAAIDRNGKFLPGFPTSIPLADFSGVNRGADPSFGVLAAPVLADIDRDGRAEIVVVGLDGFVYVFRFDGSMQPGFPVPVTYQGALAKIVSSPALYDINGDGALDIVFGTAHYSQTTGFLFAVSGRGLLDSNVILPGFPALIPLLRNKILPLIGTGIATAPAIGDVDGDGVVDIVCHGFAGKAYLLGLDGKLKRSLAMTPSSSSPAVAEEEMIVGFGQPAIADLDGDGTGDIFAPGTGRRILMNLIMGGRRILYHYLLGSWSGITGIMNPTFPRFLTDTPIMGSPIFADVTGDGRAEVIAADAGFELHGFDVAGHPGGEGNAQQMEATGFPKRTGGWMLGSPAAGDFDGDGRVDIAGATREGFVFIWPTPGKISNGGRHGYHYKGNTQRTGVWLPEPARGRR